MSSTVHCKVLKRESTGLDSPPYPGELGERIVREVSVDGWRMWLERQVMIINELQLNSADSRCLDVLEKHMIGFLFEEGDYGQAPAGFTPPAQ
ncbi:oxidative damage protection protein [Gammaproteobacteria bacterium]|nr:oxidative damage protection protein [Gammaproteobacteria bacterium]